jgi:hypothetical protein
MRMLETGRADLHVHAWESVERSYSEAETEQTILETGSN